VQDFDPEFEGRVYAELFRRAEIVLESGRPAVLDACFARARQRAIARELARRCGEPFLFVECRADPAILRSRLSARDAEGGRKGWMQIARELEEHWEPPEEIRPEERMVVDASAPVAESAAALDARLPKWPERLRS
jgi:predicted kinase